MPYAQENDAPQGRHGRARRRSVCAATVAVAVLLSAPAAGSHASVLDGGAASGAVQITEKAAQVAGQDEHTGEKGAIPDRLVVSFTPEADPLHLELEADGLAGYLAEALGIAVETQVDADYTATVEAMRSGHAHIATNLSPLQAALAHRMAGAQVILAEERDGRAYYHSRFWVRRDSAIDDLDQLQGRTIAFNDPLSGSGYLLPVAFLVREGLIDHGEDVHEFFGEVYFAGGTELSMRALVNGTVDVAAVSENAAAIFLSPEEREQVTYVAQTQPQPRHAIAVRGDLPDALIAEIKAAFLELNEPEHNEVLRGLYGWRKVVPVEAEQYLPLLDMAEDVGILSR